MRPIQTARPSSPTTQAERRELVIPFLIVHARRDDRDDRPAALADLEAELLRAGVEPSWSWARFERWVDAGAQRPGKEEIT
jgi:hypothetical protein